ncbi:phage portal protein [Paracoccus sp. (in: a-proteobacteria)]|uniref:phage portal protein n=1 Tax=Paracoccus sp. TaxID=267 RepID=UPI0026DEAD05|nr:phage portal protein [Paracoccus sp. (in: a-proteobacteria)]MDO5646311.1 phage portal protein [Paracoccus sp. (in: a-proteobacteria)]
MAFELDEKSLELLGLSGRPSSPPAPTDFRVHPGAGRELAIAGDAYEGASRVSHELASYNPAIRSPDQDLKPAKRTADGRSRDLSRNDANIQSGVRLRQDGIVGSYLMLNARPNSLMLFGKEDVTWEDEFAEEVEERFAAFAESDDRWLDAGGRHTLTSMVRQAIEQHTLYGEVLATAEWIRERDRPFSTAIQMVDTDRLSTPMHRQDDKNLSMGVQTNKWGRAVGYYIRMAHPTEWTHGADVSRWKYTPSHLHWGRRQVVHIFDQHRPGQTRGIGTLVAAIPEIKMARQFREIVLQNAILNATYAATVESDLDAASIFARLGGTDFRPEEVQSALENYMMGHYSALKTVIGSSNQLKLGGLKIPHLPPGSKLNLQGAGQGGPLGTNFEASLNRLMASALGVSYEQFSRDYTQTNYSSGKMASVETYKTMMAVKRHVADAFATSVYRLWFEEAFNKGSFKSIRRRMPSFYEDQNKEWYAACDWIGASRGQVDELKETQAAVLRINNGISDLETENARLGFDWRKRMRQMKREKEWKEFYGVLQDQTDTKNQENAASGTKREVSDE